MTVILACITTAVWAISPDTQAEGVLHRRSCAYPSYESCFNTLRAGCVNQCKEKPMDRWRVCISWCEGDIKKNCAFFGCRPGN